MAAQPSDRYLRELVLRRYVVEELVGEGSFAWVYRARDRDGEAVAVKILHSQASTAAMRFAREIRVLQALPDTPSVAHYVDHGHAPDGRPTLVIEYVDGLTLKLGLERRPTLAPDQAVAFLSDVCEAFSGLHQLGVAHRDVKPENILMARRGGIKLIDFGLIRDAQGILRLLEGEDPLETPVFQEELDRGVLAGTPEYMAPEQFTDSAVHDTSQSRTDTWSDVYSLGVIFYELLTGRKPFVMREVPEGEYAQELLRYLRWRLRIRDRDIPRISGITSALQSIVRKALRRDPRRRQPDARALLKDLQHYARTGEGVQRTDESRTMVASVSNIFAAHARSERGAAVSQVSFKLFDDGQSSEPATAAEQRAASMAEAPTGRSSETFSADPDDAFTAADAYAPTVAASRQRVGAYEEEPTPQLDRPTPDETRDITGPRRNSARPLPEAPPAASPDEPASLDDTNPRLADDLLTRTYSPLSPLEAQRVDSSDDRPDLFGDDDDLAWPEENLADPPSHDDPAILSAPTDAPSLSIEDFYEDWPDDDLAADFDDDLTDDQFVGDPREVNLADLAPRRRRNR